MGVVRRVSGIVFWGAALVLAAMVLFWLANAALGHVAASEHIGRHISKYLPDTDAQFAKARLRLSWRGVFVRAEQLHLRGKSGGLYAPRADFFLSTDKAARLALHSPRITIINGGDDGDNGDGDSRDGGGFGFPLPVVGEDWAVVGDDAVFVAAGFGFDDWLPQLAADFTILARGGTLQLAINEGGENAVLAQWQNGGGIARLVITRPDGDLPMRSLHLTAAIDNDAVSVIAAVGGLRADGFFAPSAVVRARMPQSALLEWAAAGGGGEGLPSSVSMSAQFYDAEVDGLPKSDIAAAGVLHSSPGGGFGVVADSFVLGNESGALSGGGTVVIGGDGGAGLSLASLNISGNVAASVADLYRYLPPSDARAWMEESLTGGDIGAAAFAISGTAEDIANGRGWGLTAAFSGGNIVIGAGWPDAKALAGALFLHNDNITIIGEGVFSGLAVTDITAVIDNFAADAPASLRLLMRASPAPLGEYKRAALAVDALRPALTVVQTANFSGGGALAVLLTVPLASPQDTFYHVSIGVRDGMLAPGDAPLPTLTSLSGAVVAGNGFFAAAMDGLLYEFPAEVFFDGAGATLRSTMRVARALSLAGAEEWGEYLSGDAAFTLHTGGGKTTIFADMGGITSALPPPLDNAGGGLMRLLVKDGGDTSVVITAPSATIRVATTGGDIAAAINAPLPSMGIAAAGEGWDLDEWLGLAGGGGLALSMMVVDGKLLGMRHASLHLRMPPSSGDMRMAYLQSPLMAGTAAFSPRAVRGDFDKLHLTGFDGGGDALSGGLFGLSVSLRVRQLALGGITLGAMTMSGAPEGAGWRLSQMRITDGGNVLRFAGFGGFGGATVSAGLQAPDLERLLGQFGLTGLVESGAMTVSGKLSWDEFAPSLAILRGDLHLDADEVRYLRMQEGVSGLLALFSPASLFSLGFTELGKPGVRFDIDGDIVLGSGFAASESLTMRNEDIHITLGGRTDLLRRRHNIRGRVLPGNRLVKSGSTVATIATVVNPPVLLAGVLLGKILEKPLSEIGAYDYEITGDWSDPQYRELGFADQ